MSTPPWYQRLLIYALLGACALYLYEDYIVGAVIAIGVAYIIVTNPEFGITVGWIVSGGIAIILVSLVLAIVVGWIAITLGATVEVDEL